MEFSCGVASVLYPTTDNSDCDHAELTRCVVAAKVLFHPVMSCLLMLVFHYANQVLNYIVFALIENLFSKNRFVA